MEGGEERETEGGLEAKRKGQRQRGAGGEEGECAGNDRNEEERWREETFCLSAGILLFLFLRGRNVSHKDRDMKTHSCPV